MIKNIVIILLIPFNLFGQQPTKVNVLWVNDSIKVGTKIQSPLYKQGTDTLATKAYSRQIAGAKVAYTDSLIKYVTPWQLSDSLQTIMFDTTSIYQELAKKVSLIDSLTIYATPSQVRDSCLVERPHDSIMFNTFTASGHDPGKVWYEDGILNIDSDIPGVTMNNGEEIWSRKVRNNTGAIIPNGRVVRISGNIGNKATIALASYSTEDSSSSTLGVATHDIAINGDGRITLLGKIGDIATNSFSAGDTLYLSYSGTLRKTKPTTGIPIRIGYVEYSHAINGRIIVNIERCNDIRTTTKTNITGILKGSNNYIAQAVIGTDYLKDSTHFLDAIDSISTANKLLTYNQYNALNPVHANIASSKVGRIAFFDNTTNRVRGSDNFFYDSTNIRLGLGTQTPTNDLSFSNSANKTIGIEAVTTASTVGRSLTLSGGQSGAGSNIYGGDINYYPGKGTGSGSSAHYFYVPRQTVSPTDVQSYGLALTISKHLHPSAVGLNYIAPANNVSDAASKYGFICAVPYRTNGTQYPITAIETYTDNVSQLINIGGGFTYGSSATNINFFTNTYAALGAGTKALSIDNTQTIAMNSNKNFLFQQTIGSNTNGDGYLKSTTDYSLITGTRVAGNEFPTCSISSAGSVIATKFTNNDAVADSSKISIGFTKTLIAAAKTGTSRTMAFYGSNGTLTGNDTLKFINSNIYKKSIINDSIISNTRKYINDKILSATNGDVTVVDTSYNAATNLFPSTGSGLAGAVKAGDWYRVGYNKGGTLGGVAVVWKSTLVALIDNPGQTLANWDVRTEPNIPVARLGSDAGIGFVKYNGNTSTRVAGTFDGYNNAINLPTISGSKILNYNGLFYAPYIGAFSSNGTAMTVNISSGSGASFRCGSNTAITNNLQEWYSNGVTVANMNYTGKLTTSGGAYFGGQVDASGGGIKIQSQTSVKTLSISNDGAVNRYENCGIYINQGGEKVYSNSYSNLFSIIRNYSGDKKIYSPMIYLSDIHQSPIHKDSVNGQMIQCYTGNNGVGVETFIINPRLKNTVGNITNNLMYLRSYYKASTMKTDLVQIKDSAETVFVIDTFDQVILKGKGKVWNDIAIGGFNIPSTTNVPTFTTGWAGSSLIGAYYFQGTTQNDICYFNIQVPHDCAVNDSLRIHIHGGATTTPVSTDTVVFRLTYTYSEITGTFPAVTSVDVKVPLNGQAQWSHQIVNLVTLTTGTGNGISGIYNCSLQRLQDNVSDTYTGNWGLLSIDAHAKIDRLGSKQYNSK